MECVSFMWQGLTKLLADNSPEGMKETKFESYFGRKIAIDASMSIYQFLVSEILSWVGSGLLELESGGQTSRPTQEGLTEQILI